MIRLQLRQFYVGLAACVLFAAALRFVALGQFPPSLLQDEAALGYNAMSIAETGKDEYGEFLPLSFKSFGDYKPPVYVYLTALLYRFIGWSPALPRLVSAISGVGSVLILGLWLELLTHSRRISLMGALLLALSPWALHLNRMGLESSAGLIFFLLGLYFSERLRHQSNWLMIMLAVFSYTLSAYSFHSYRFIVIAYTGFVLCLSSFKPGKLSGCIGLPAKVPLAIFLLTLILVFPGLISQRGLTRFNQTLLVNDASKEMLFQTYRNSCHVLRVGMGLPVIDSVCQLVWNKYTYGVHILTTSLIRHVSPQFLFFYGDETFNRNPTGSGEMYVYLLPLWLLGMYVALKSPKYYHLLAGFFIAMVPAILTGPPHSTRLSGQIPFLIALIVLGYRRLLLKIPLIQGALLLCLFLSTSYFALHYALVTFVHNQEFLGHSQAIAQTIHAYYQSGYTVYVDQDVLAEPYIFYLFWNHIPPSQYLATDKHFVTDQWGFTRPDKIGSKLIFDEGTVRSLPCKSALNPLIAFITNEALPYPPVKTITNNGSALTLAYVYDFNVIEKEYCSQGN